LPSQVVRCRTEWEGGMLKLRNLIVVVMCMFPGVALPGSVAGTGGSTEITQLANNTQLAMSYTEQAQQTIHQFNQYQAMLKNLLRLTPSNVADTSARKLWNDNNMNDTFRNMYRIVVGGQQMAYSLSNMDQQFQNLHPGYGNYGNGFNYQDAYRNWSDTTRGSVMGSLRMATVQADDLQSERDLVGALSDSSSTAEGQLQAVQAGNQIGVAMVGQMQKLRQLQMAQLQAQNTVALAEQGRKGASDEWMRKYMNQKYDRRPLSERIKD